MIHGKRADSGGSLSLIKEAVLILLVIAIIASLYYVIVIKKGFQPLQNSTTCTAGTYFLFNGTCETKGLCPEGSKALGIGTCSEGKECCIYNNQI
jgi:hypothetical protein